MTIQPGINVIFPFQISYKAEGTFSRWGYYEAYNEKPITDDPFYNYFTNEPRTYEDQGTYSLQLEGQLRLNFLLNVFNKNPDNGLIIGLIGSIPLSNSPTYNYSQGIAEYDYNGYWISTENEEYHGLTFSRDKLYNFFVGLSVGINLVKYKAR